MLTERDLPRMLRSETEVESALGQAAPPVARAIERCLQGRDPSESQVIQLFQAQDADYQVLLRAADFLRWRTVGDLVTYVVNRNINFTNVCIKRCGFCAFSRTVASTEGYHLPLEEIIRRTLEAKRYGASEVCIQAGLPPGMDGRYYIELCRAVKEAAPAIHLHAFSPEEILYGSKQSRISIRHYLQALKEAGIGSLPGTSAEILDDRVRKIIAPGRISTDQWIEVVTTAHSLGIPTSSTIMYGHLETPRHRARHLLLLRDLQRRSRGFTEFVPLSFIHSEAPMFPTGASPGYGPGPAERGDRASQLHPFRGAHVRRPAHPRDTGRGRPKRLKMHAVARLVLNRDIPNIQASWVKEGLTLGQACLESGANDFGGTLMNESISTAAGAPHGQLVRPRDLRRCIREVGRIPALRSTLYAILRRFPDEGQDGQDPLDKLDARQKDPFGSYHQLIRQERFRFNKRDRRPSS